MSKPNWKHLPTHLFEYISTYVDTISANGLLVVSCRKTCPIEPYDIIRWIKRGGDLGGITMDIYSMPTIKITDVIHMIYLAYAAGYISNNHLGWIKKNNIQLDTGFIYILLSNQDEFETMSNQIISYLPHFKYTIASCDMYTILIASMSKGDIYNIIKWAFTMKCRIYNRNQAFWDILLHLTSRLIGPQNRYIGLNIQYSILMTKYILSMIIDNIDIDFSYWCTFIPDASNLKLIELKHARYDNSLIALLNDINNIITLRNIKRKRSSIGTIPNRFSLTPLVPLDMHIRELFHKL